MSAKMKDDETSASAATNVALFLGTVRGVSGIEKAKAASPADKVLALLQAGPKSPQSLMDEGGFAFNELDEALTRLEDRGLIVADGEGGNRRYRLAPVTK